VFALLTILVWLWTGTAFIPEKPAKGVGQGLTLPLYASGSGSVGWWAMFITMLGDMTAFFSLIFGYFFFWTSRPDFLAEAAAGPGTRWPLSALALAAGAWVLTIAARRFNSKDAAGPFYASVLLAMVCALGSAAAFVAGPVATGLDPERHVYPATVWVLVVWMAAHLAAGVVMQAYCAVRRLAGRMTATHEIDIGNVTLYWHFMAATAGVTVAVVAGFPLLQ
jgi:cytochrome c oxidase subunit I+III